MQIFGGKLQFKDRVTSDQTFNTITESLLTVFQILTGEDWNSVMYDGVKSQSSSKNIGLGNLVWASYFVILFVLGNYILLNVFLAIAVDNLADADSLTQTKEQKERENAKQRARILKNISVFKRKSVVGNSPADSTSTTNQSAKPRLELEGDLPPKYRKDCENNGKKYLLQKKDEVLSDEESIHLPEGDDDSEPEVPIGPRPTRLADLNLQTKTTPMPEYSSFFIFSPENSFRKLCHKIVNLNIFNNIILLCICFSSITLAFESPIPTSNKFITSLLEGIDIFFTLIFFIEICLKMVADGFILHKGAFCRSLSNILDVMVVSVSIMSFTNTSTKLSSFKMVRIFKVLRPLRAINRAKGLKNVVQCVAVALGTISNILMVTILLVFMFACIGMQLFNGHLYACSDPSVKEKKMCWGQYHDSNSKGETMVNSRVWENADFHFDNIFSAMLTLFFT